MKIEVVSTPDVTAKEKGDLLEALAGDLLTAQSYRVIKQVRVTAAELDLLCEHSVSGKSIYVECKAHRESLSANCFTNLLGTVTLKDYEEGWLISSGPLGKDAKGFLVEWEKKPQVQRSKLSIYTPERVIESLINTARIKAPPESEVRETINEGTTIGDWTLLISPWGNYWACLCLEQGIPIGAIIFDSKTGQLVRNRDLLARLKASDTSLAALAFDYVLREKHPVSEIRPESAVVEVEFGESWTDYRPARPEHFVGRTKIQRDVIRFLTAVKMRRTDTRVFAIKGDSGIGKSSLIAKLRHRANTSKKPSGVLMFAVDVRAANTTAYVHESLITALRRAAALGFGTRDPELLKLTDVSDPLQSETIASFLRECERRKQLIVLVFDQFEELYSKPELFGVFEEARRLMFSAVSAATNFALGFSWKTDSTVPQDHPAYYMWHQLADHRFEVTLSPFTRADAENSLHLFEKELGARLRAELRQYVIAQSQGYPWLIKKLCIHLYEQLKGGASQTELADRSLDIAQLFDRDLSTLTPGEDACVKLIAKNAPIDWYEVLETAGNDVVRSLQDKRLIIRRGDKLNLYWDIFREYVLNRSIPHIPFTHVPQSPSINALLNVASQLDPGEGRSIAEIGALCGYSANTVNNIVHDLAQFGIASIEGALVYLDNHISDGSTPGILAHIRLVLRRHALTAVLRQLPKGTPVTQDVLIQFLRRLNPTAKHHSRTWLTYANRMALWLTITGYVRQMESCWLFDDTGEIQDTYSGSLSGKAAKRRRIVFLGDAPPGRVVEALEYIRRNSPQSVLKMKSLGYRNACAVLFRFGLVALSTEHNYQLSEYASNTETPLEAVWRKAKDEDTLKEVIGFLQTKPTASSVSIGKAVADSYDRDWTPATLRRTGNSLRQWASWIILGTQRGEIPPPPGQAPQDDEPQIGDLFGQ
jgi:hypothetical protein